MTNYNKKLVELTHLLMCKMPHYSGTPEGLLDRSEGLCYFEQESTLTDAVAQPDHDEWIRNTDELVTELNLGTHEETYKKILELLSLLRKINELTPESDALWKFIFKIA